MLWPNEAKSAIANAFYDKTIETLSQATTIDAEGGVVRGNTTVQSTFQGNVQFSNLGELQAELGLTESIDITVTCAPDTAISVDARFRYNGKTYRALSVIPSDSHLTIVGKNE